MESSRFQNSNSFKEFLIKLYSVIMMFFATLFIANPNNNRNNTRPNSNLGTSGFNNSSSTSSTRPPENDYTSSFRRFGGMGGG